MNSPAHNSRLIALGWVFAVMAAWIATTDGAEFPTVANLPAIRELPDPLVMFDGSNVTTADAWQRERRPELVRLFQHYMYGYAPPAPSNVRAIETRTHEVFDGRASMRQVTLAFGPPDTPKIELLLFQPVEAERPVPIFVAINFPGNHAVTPDPRVKLPEVWIPDHFVGVDNNRATDAGRGAYLREWPIEAIVRRGYAVATFYCGDVDPDRPDFSDGVHPHFYWQGQDHPGPHEWGTIAAWTWGLSRAIDYLAADPTIDNRRFAVMGHSRLGKAAMLAGALDQRIALVVANQAGCGGTSPSRSPRGEQLVDINTRFPHWFNDTFPSFNDAPVKLPFDQHSLIALCAPRPVLLANAEEDQWADPAGQFEALKAAEPVYALLDAGGCDAEKMPPVGRLVDSTLGYRIRAGKHEVLATDWDAFLDFAEHHLSPAKD